MKYLILVAALFLTTAAVPADWVVAYTDKTGPQYVIPTCNDDGMNRDCEPGSLFMGEIDGPDNEDEDDK